MNRRPRASASLTIAFSPADSAAADGYHLYAYRIASVSCAPPLAR